LEFSLTCKAAHYDTISEKSFSAAPGANDDGKIFEEISKMIRIRKCSSDALGPIIFDYSHNEDHSLCTFQRRGARPIWVSALRFNVES
jgi:glycosidase